MTVEPFEMLGATGLQNSPELVYLGRLVGVPTGVRVGEVSDAAITPGSGVVCSVTVDLVGRTEFRVHLWL